MSNRVGSGQVSITTVAKQIVPANGARSQLTVTKVGSQDLFLGCDLSTSATSGHQFAGACGTSITLEGFRGALWGITGAGSTTVTFLEVTQL